MTILFCSTSNSQTVDCKKFRNGTFYYPGMPGKVSVRLDSIQKSYSNDKLEMIWRVKWITDCQYEMRCDLVLGDTSFVRRGDRIVANIINADENCFTASLVYYTPENPMGEKLPGGPLCIKRE